MMTRTTERYDAIPPDLANLRRWVVAGADKKPKSPTTLSLADVTDPATWDTYAAAITAVKRAATTRHPLHLGYVLGDGIIGIDIDHCINEDGELTNQAAAIVRLLGGYTERSVSGTGIHIFCRGELPAGGRKRNGTELYDRDRFFVVTGDVLPGSLHQLPERTTELSMLHQMIFPRASAPTPLTQPLVTQDKRNDDDTVLHRCLRSERFRRLWNGDLTNFADSSADGFDLSAAELSLANSLANHGGDAAAIDRLYRQWPCARTKWDERRGSSTYGQDTIAKAVASVRFVPMVTRHPTVARGDCPDLATQLAIAELRITELETELARESARADAAEAACSELRTENSMIVNVATNPHLGGAAPTIIRTVARCHRARMHGEQDERGFIRAPYTSIGDDHENQEGPPIRGRATVKRDYHRLAAAGLIELDKRPETVETTFTNKRTGEQSKKRVSTEVSWVRFTGETVTEILQPFAFFRPPTPTTDISQPTLKHGGDRRSDRFKATRQPCPDCGSTERRTYCTGCGCDITEVVEREETTRFHHETRSMTLPPSDVVTRFQDDTQSNNPTGGDFRFQDETWSGERHHPTQSRPETLSHSTPPVGSLFVDLDDDEGERPSLSSYHFAD